MKAITAALAAITAGLASSLSPAAAQDTMAPGSMPMDTPTNIDGVNTVCTGIGLEAQSNPQWLSYPVRVEFSNGGAQWLSGAHIDLSTAGGRPIASLECSGPWVLFRLEPGAYKVTASLHTQPGGGSASATFSPPRAGQKRVILRFPVNANT